VAYSRCPRNRTLFPRGSILTQYSLSFLIAALSYGGACVWSLRSKAWPLRSARVRLALAASAVWAITLLPTTHGPEWRLLPYIEVLRYWGWLIAMPVLLRRAPGTGTWLARFNLAAGVAGLLIAPFSLVLSVLVLAFASLVNVEHILRTAEPEQKPGAKLCAIGLGGLFTYDLYSYSQYVLAGEANPAVWEFRDIVSVGLLPFLLLGLLRLARVPSTLFVSRQAVFYSTTFLAVGVYLILIAAAAQYLRGQQTSWSQWLQPVLLGGAALVLVVLVATESPWRRLRVFLAKHFYRNKYDYRVEWLRFVRNLSDGPLTDARVIVIRAIAQIFESRGGVLFLREEGDGAYVAVATWSAEEQSAPVLAPIPIEQDMIRFMAHREWVIDIDEYRRNRSVYDSIELPAFLLHASSRWRIVSPLFEGEQLQGFLILQRPPEPFTMTFEDRDLLRMVGRHVATLLAQQAADRRLAESRQFDAFNRFAAFVMHDLKNAVAQLQLLASNATRHRHNPEFIDDAFITIENTAARITRLIDQLQTRDARAGEQEVAMEHVITAAIGRCAAQQPTPELVMEAPDAYVRADPERLVAVLEHVLRNAQDAAGAAGKVTISARRTGAQVTVTIADTGPGMDADFIRNRLFRPFDSTKGGKGMGIGAYQLREYVLEAGGTVEVQSTPGSGTRFIIKLPLCENNDPKS
jgi:putative PEP-CTERM system histidine kinase